MVRTAAIDHDLIVPIMSTLTKVLAEQPISEAKSRLSKRIRHGMRCIIDKHGRLGHAALLHALKCNTPLGLEATRSELGEWAAQAAAKLSSLPLTPEEWLTVLTSPDSIMDMPTYNERQGHAEWAYTSKTSNGLATPTTFMTWNANSLFKRIRQGDLSRILEDGTPDVMQVSEVKGEPGTDLGASELRQALAALGCVHVAWNRCFKTPSIHGSAVFSKIPMTKITYGTRGDNVDPEGRTNTTYFNNMAQV